MRRLAVQIFCSVILLSATVALAAGKAEHVVVIVWDGMRPDFISRKHTPTLYQLARGGVKFQNHHSVYCTTTDVNGTTLATGAYPAHSGVIANLEHWPEINPLKAVTASVLDTVRKGDDLTGGHYLLCPTVAEILQDAGRKTAIAGTKNVVLLFDRRERANAACVNLFAGKTLSPTALAAITNSFGTFPESVDAKSSTPNEKRDAWTTRALLGPLWSNGVPAFSLLWLGEPDFSQHTTGPGSAKALAAIESSDRQLAAVLNELDRRQLRGKTDVFVVSDHGFSPVEQAVSIRVELQKAGFRAWREFQSPPQKGDILIVGQGGSVLFYVMGNDTEVTAKLVEFLQRQEYTGVIFTREKMEGTFALADANINCPNPPDVVMAMRWSPDKSKAGVRGLLWSDGARQPRGNHASLSRFDVHNMLVATGPDLKKRFEDKLPTGNTDLAPTILWLLGVKPKEPMDGRVLGEALSIEAPPVGKPITRRLEASHKLEKTVWRQYLQVSQVGGTSYVDEGNSSGLKK